MAVAKKKKKDKSANPNIVLIIFLVFFFLVTIGLGIWIYYEHDEQKRLKDVAAKMKLEKIGAEKAVDYYRTLSREFRLALGETLLEDENEDFNENRGEFWKVDFGKFKDEKTKEAAKKSLEELRTTLGLADDQKNLKTNYKKEVEEARKEAKRLQAELEGLKNKSKRAENTSNTLTENLDDYFKKGTKRSEDHNAEMLAEAKKQSDNFKALEKSKAALQEELTKKEEKFAEVAADYEKEIKGLKREIGRLEAEQKVIAAGGGNGGPAAPLTPGGMPLILSVSTAKPLWDHPVGKVVRVDAESRQIVINLGLVHGVKPELTFNIFGANASGRAENHLKGTIEVIKVLDGTSSLARVTSLYDAEGRDIPLSELSRSRLLRDSEAPLREGDLLFNLFWGTRVAIAGYVSITGESSDNPGEQIRQMEEFKHLVKRNGMLVDAFIDVSDGKINGNLTSKTRYLIVGEEVRGPKEAKAAPVMKEKDGDEKEAPKEAPKEAAAGVGDERAKSMMLSQDALFKEAMQKGLLIISAENFATMIGYRRARSANSPEISAFRPALPYAGTEGGVVVNARPKVDEEKKVEMKEMDKEKDKEKDKDN